MSIKGFVRLRNLREGAVFENLEGIRAVKSEYKYSNEPFSQSLCVLLASGEFAHFENKDEEWVKEVVIGLG